MIPLEDNFNDVIGKAQRGLKLSDDQLAQKTGVSVADLSRVKEGQFDERIVRKLSPALNLGANALAALGRKSWYPQEAGLTPGLAMFTTTYGDMTVNSFLAWDSKTKTAVFFDTGADASLQIETRQTSGHSKGGITYVITGLSMPVAVVGDSIFASSMGGGMISYEDALRNNLENILTLSDNTILCPGHGPLTTVGEEKAHNPFFT
jgi:hydroxyacylglutathione hydrolase